MKAHEVEEVRIEEDKLVLVVDGMHKEYPIAEISDRLEEATEEQRKTFEVSPSGYGIHWPLIDEDLSIDGLLGIVHQPSQKSKAA